MALNFNKSTSKLAFRHVRLGILTGYERQKELCEMCMSYAGLTYEFVVEDELGHLNTSHPDVSSGAMGDLINGHIDILCVQTVMNTARLAIFDFTYPTSGPVRDVYLLRNTTLNHQIHQYAFIGRPFIWTMWMVVLISAIVTIGCFSIMQALIVDASLSAPIRAISAGIFWWTELSMGLKYGIMRKYKNNFASVKIASALWLLLWGPIILQLYQANLKSYLSVSDRLNLPFSDFEGLLLALRSEHYRLLSVNGIVPFCPTAYGSDDDCWKMFHQILDKQPGFDTEALIKSLNDLPGNIVQVASYSTVLVPDKVSLILDDDTVKSRLLAIRNDQISLPPAAFPMRKGLEHRRQLDQAVIALQLAFTLLGIGLGASFCAFLIEIGFSSFYGKCK